MPDDTTDTLPPAIRKEIIEAQHAKIAAYANQLQAARAKQVEAVIAASAAEDAVTTSIRKAAESGTDPDLAVMMSLQQAQAQAELHGRMVQHLERMHLDAQAGLKPAQHRAHIGMYARAVQRRIEAAAKIETARSLALEGRRLHDLATSSIQEAHRLGVQHPQPNGSGGLSIQMPVPLIETTTEEGEREFWANRSAVGAEWPHTPEDQLLTTHPSGLQVAA